MSAPQIVDSSHEPARQFVEVKEGRNRPLAEQVGQRRPDLPGMQWRRRVVFQWKLDPGLGRRFRSRRCFHRDGDWRIAFGQRDQAEPP